MRGRLIFPHTVRIARVDPDGIDKAPAADDGMDADFREPRPEVSGGRVVPIRRELAAIDVPAQVEPEVFESLADASAGQAAGARVEIVLHMRDLEDRGLTDVNGRPTLRAGDRITGFYGRDGGLMLAPRVALYVESITPRGWGLGSSRYNLLSVILVERPEGVQAVPA